LVRLGRDLVEESDSPVHDLVGFVFVGAVAGLDTPLTLTRLVKAVKKPLSKDCSSVVDEATDDAMLRASMSDDGRSVMIESDRRCKVETAITQDGCDDD